jgi:hypothetical protein
MKIISPGTDPRWNDHLANSGRPLAIGMAREPTDRLFAGAPQDFRPEIRSGKEAQVLGQPDDKRPVECRPSRGGGTRA